MHKRELNPNNYVQLLGKLFEQPQVRYTPGGLAIASLRVSKSMGKNKKTDEWYPSLWTKWTAFGELAEEVSQLQKGQVILLKGDMKPEEWMDKKSGEKRTAIGFTLSAYEVHAALDNAQQ